MVSPDSQAIACPLSGRNSTYRTVQISGTGSHFDPSLFQDRYENALIDLLKKKEAGEKIEPSREVAAPRVVNLMDALRASIDTEKKKAPAPSTEARRGAKRRASQK